MNGATDVVVIGGGLTGLAAAAYLGRAGRRVMVLEKAGSVGGRAATHKKEGFSLNLGPHALYRGSTGLPVLRELGVEPQGSVPRASGFFTLRGGELHTMPSGLLSLLTTGLLPLSAKFELARILASVGSIYAPALKSVSAAAWLDRNVRAPEVRQFLEGMFRLSTYSADLGRLSAEVAVDQIQIVLKANVMYVDDGWQTLVSGLRAAAEAAGASITTEARAAAVEVEGGQVRGVRLADGSRIAASTAVIAASPGVASALVPGNSHLAEWARRAIPVKAACLDLALSRTPRPRSVFALGLDKPLYFSLHSATARLGPEGGAVIHVAEYLTEGREAAEAELEALCDRMQPGWRDLVVERRFLPSMTVSNALVTAEGGGFAGRPGPEVPSAEGLFVAGDWVGAEGLLADAGLASAKRAAELAAAQRAERIAA